VAERKLRKMSLQEVRQECETPTVAERAWFRDNHPLKMRYTKAACGRAADLEQRAWLKKVPCDELRRRLWTDIPYRPDLPSAQTLRQRLWTCRMQTTYFDRLDLENMPRAKNPTALATKAMAALAGAGQQVVDSLVGYLGTSKDAFGAITQQGGIYNVFRGLGIWLAKARPARCLETARAFLPAVEADARRAAEGYRGVNGVIHGLLDGGCYRGMSLLAGREIRVRVQRAIKEGRTSELTRCKWLGRYGSPEGQKDLEAVFSDAALKGWVEAHSPVCLFALDKVRKPYVPPKKD